MKVPGVVTGYFVYENSYGLNKATARLEFSFSLRFYVMRKRR